MGTDAGAKAVDPRLAVGGPLAAAVAVRDNRFWFGLAFAAALHAALIFGITRSSPRQMGERSGRPDGISVTLVDAPDLKSKNTFREEGAPAPPAIAQPPAPARPQPPAPKATEPPAPKSEAAPPAPRALEEQKTAIPPRDKETLEPRASPGPATKPSEPESTAKLPPKQDRQAKPQLDIAIPNIPVSPGARAAAVMRPPGATRSGENDEFGRGVIRALRQTMPSPNGQLGRVTVRLLLSGNGNLIEVLMIRSAGIPGLDQSVVFAVKQASFPIPPGGATVVDRTFLVTYIYN